MQVTTNFNTQPFYLQIQLTKSIYKQALCKRGAESLGRAINRSFGFLNRHSTHYAVKLSGIGNESYVGFKLREYKDRLYLSTRTFINAFVWIHFVIQNEINLPSTTW